MDIEQSIIQFILKLLAYGGSGALVAYGLFKFLGKKWIENKFQKSLENHKHKHDEEIQRLKCEIDLQLSRVTKIHEKEFEVLPQAWVKLDNLSDLNRQFLRETYHIPELDQKPPSELEKFLSEHDCTESAKQRICRAADKKSQYFHEKSKKFTDACLDFQDYIAKNAIFLSSDIKGKFKEAEITIRGVWAIREATENTQGRQEGIMKVCNIVTEKIPPIMDEIEQLVQKRLRFHEA